MKIYLLQSNPLIKSNQAFPFLRMSSIWPFLTRFATRALDRGGLARVTDRRRS